MAMVVIHTFENAPKTLFVELEADFKNWEIESQFVSDHINVEVNDKGMTISGINDQQGMVFLLKSK